MKCAECNSSTQVYDTRIINGERIRYRKCRKCAATFSTKEVLRFAPPVVKYQPIGNLQEATQWRA